MQAGVELRLLRYVIAVAEELQFSRAASREHVTQPSLSRQIQDLETRLGVLLFARHHRQVVLTDAGHAFVEEARRSLAHAEEAVRAAKARRAAAQKEVRIGYSPAINLQLLTVVRDVARSFDQTLRVKFTSAHTPDQFQALGDGTIHLGLVTLPFRHEALTIKRLLSEPLTVALQTSHRLSLKVQLKARELNGLAIICFSRRLHPLYHDQLFRLLKKEGLTPETVQEVTTESEALFMVAEGLGAALIRPSLHSILQPGVVFRRFRERCLVQDTALAYRRQSLPWPIEPLVNLICKTVEHKNRNSFGVLGLGDEASDSRQLNLF